MGWRPQAGAKRQAAHGRSAPTPDVLGLAAGSATCTFPRRTDSVHGVELFAPTAQLGEGGLYCVVVQRISHIAYPSQVRTCAHTELVISSQHSSCTGGRAG